MSIVTTFGDLIGKDFSSLRDMEEWILYGDDLTARTFKRLPVTDENV
jgi:hypothetical protein